MEIICISPVEKNKDEALLESNVILKDKLQLKKSVF